MDILLLIFDGKILTNSQAGQQLLLKKNPSTWV
jgi:hypothetical protein